MNMTVVSNEKLCEGVYRMLVNGDTRGISRPGQFVQVSLKNYFLRRPISVCDCVISENGTLDIVYRVVGRGTLEMSNAQIGDVFDMLTGLGNGFDTSASKSPLLIGGGVGAPPLYWLCKELLSLGKRPIVALGFNTASDTILINEFKALASEVFVATLDGSMGQKGFVTDALSKPLAECDGVFACGPLPMLKAVFAACGKVGVSGQFNLEERMACGFGACMGCTINTRAGAKRVCADGPVFRGEDLLW